MIPANNNNNGKFVISLDFELFWGVRDKTTIEKYGNNVLGVHTVIPQLLQYFTKYKIKATFSAVGFLFFENKADLLSSLPSKKPNYINTDYSPYLGYMDNVGINYTADKYHYAPELINLIKQHPEQEIGSHTFSHYYCLEKGQTTEEFKEDMICAKKVAQEKGIEIKSLVFPRNQFNKECLQVCKDIGITCYRGNEQSWLYKAKTQKEKTNLNRFLRLIDSYINISGHNCYTVDYSKNNILTNIPSSSFLRPYVKGFAFLNFLKLKRIKNAMSHAAKNNLTYHLWWHPHNFGINQTQNFSFLEKILTHYKILNTKYNFQSITMSVLAAQLPDTII